jgi:hypothetical protein
MPSNQACLCVMSTDASGAARGILAGASVTHLRSANRVGTALRFRACTDDKAGMLNRIPRSLPSLSMMLDDLGRPAPAVLARALCVSTSTARRWISEDSAPFAVLVSIFWVTRWGISAIDAEAYNSATMHAGLAAQLKLDLADSRRQVARLVELLDQAKHFDQAANAPFYSADAPPVIETGNALRM